MSFCKEKIGIDPEVLGYQILVLAPAVDKDKKTKGGILLPSGIQEEQQRRRNLGMILKIGPSAFKDKCQDRECKVGDWIAYSNFERLPEYIDDHVLYYISDANIIARYSEEDAQKLLQKIK